MSESSDEGTFVREPAFKRSKLSDESPRAILEQIMESRLDEKVEEYMKRKEISQHQSDLGRNEHNPKAKGDIIPPFDPDDETMDATSWLNKIEQLSRIHNWSEYAKSCYMQERLIGEARAWHNKVEDYDLSWSQWKTEIISAFPRKTDFAITLEHLVARKKLPNESMTQYFRSKLSLIKQCRLDNDAAISCMIRGLPIELQANARAFKCDKPNDLYIGFLSALDKYQSPGSSSRSEHHSSFRPKPNQNLQATNGERNRFNNNKC